MFMVDAYLSLSSINSLFSIAMEIYKKGHYLGFKLFTHIKCVIIY